VGGISGDMGEDAVDEADGDENWAGEREGDEDVVEAGGGAVIRDRVGSMTGFTPLGMWTP